LGSRAKTARRLLVVLYHVVPILLVYVRDRHCFVLFGRGREVSSEEHRRRAESILDRFIALGPTFIKLGQLLSTRADVVPREYTRTFSKLQDEVPPDDWEEVEDIIEMDIGGTDRFDAFRKEAINGASLGQVYVARVYGRRVAVKVLRPGVRETVETDVRLLKTFLPFVKRFVGENAAQSAENVVNQFEDSILTELDYEREAQTIEEVRQNFADDPDVVVPRVYPSLSGERVVTMEYVESIKIDDAERLRSAGVDPKETVREIQQAYAKMVLEDGVFHADPHPGNLGVDTEGRLVFYDFGLVGRISEETREGLFEFYEAIQDEDVDRMTKIFADIGILQSGYDPDAVAEMFHVMIDDLKGKGAKETSAQNIVTDVQDSMYGFPVQVTRELALLFRAITVLEGVCASLDEEFDFTYEAYLYVLRQEHGVVADAVEMVPDAVRERIGDENLYRVKKSMEPFAEFIRELRGEG
jgi:predicted unusual protein kinase regulating ubiquinone biosynthesis (AarF/ABC1/UbiB family)